MPRDALNTDSRTVPAYPVCRNHAADGPGLFRRHAHQPRQPVLGHGIRAHHFPGVDQQRHIQISHCLKYCKQFRGVQVPVVDVGADLDTAQANLLASLPSMSSLCFNLSLSSKSSFGIEPSDLVPSLTQTWSTESFACFIVLLLSCLPQSA